MAPTGPGETYATAGVDIDAADRAVGAIARHVARTERPGVVGSIGGFGGLFDLAAAGHAGARLVATTDGVGTKALVAEATGRYDTIGIDLVAMCVDDLVCQGAEPLFLLDYVSVGHLDVDMVEALVAGVAEGCRRAGCALIGGEMAEHPGVLDPGAFDLVGFAVGAVAPGAELDGRALVAPDDVLVGLASPNLRSNGFSLARKVLLDLEGRTLDEPAWSGATETLADVLLDPSVIYAPAVLAAIGLGGVHAAAHITGGGFAGNLPRVLPVGLGAEIDVDAWSVPPVFGEIQRAGNVAGAEMYRVFNMGVGMVLVVAPAAADAVRDVVADHGHAASVIGRVVAGDGVDLVGGGPR